MTDLEFQKGNRKRTDRVKQRDMTKRSGSRAIVPLPNPTVGGQHKCLLPLLLVIAATERSAVVPKGYNSYEALPKTTRS